FPSFFYAKKDSFTHTSFPLKASPSATTLLNSSYCKKLQVNRTDFFKNDSHRKNIFFLRYCNI
ncbi:MAG: hypothetical protein V4489_03050, partial [Chlamydiota bacterium]